MKKILTLFTALLVLGSMWANSAADTSGKLPGLFSISPTQKVQFSQGNLQYQQTSNTWRLAPNQFDWCGDNNLEMGNINYAGWVDLFAWSIGTENNYGATSNYNPATYVNKKFVDWGYVFGGNDWCSLSKDEWTYLLNTRTGANDKWGMAMIEDTLGMILLPDTWTAPEGITFVPRTYPTSGLWRDEDCIEDLAPELIEDDCLKYRVKKENMPANKFTLAQWAELEAAGAVFLPYAGRRSGGYGNYLNIDAVEQSEMVRYVYYENYLGTYWTSTLHNAAKGQADYIYTFSYYGGEDWRWGKNVIWSENGRYGQSVRLVSPIYHEIRTDLTPGWYYTMCLNQAVSHVKGGTFWKVISKAENGTDVILEEVELPLEKGRPYVFKATADKLEVTYTGTAVSDPVNDAANNGLVGSFNQTKIEANGNNYIIYNNALYEVNTENVYVGANRAYLNMAAVPDYNPAVAPAPGIRRVYMSVYGEQTTTGMDELNASEAPAKVMIDGQLFILRGEKKYNANGQLVK